MVIIYWFNVKRTILIPKGIAIINFIDKSTTKDLESLIYQHIINQIITIIIADLVTRSLQALV